MVLTAQILPEKINTILTGHIKEFTNLSLWVFL